MLKLGFEKRQRIAKIFGRIAEYTVSIMILGALVTGRSDASLIVIGFLLFSIFFLISVITEPVEEAKL